MQQALCIIFQPNKRQQSAGVRSARRRLRLALASFGRNGSTVFGHRNKMAMSIASSQLCLAQQLRILSTPLCHAVRNIAERFTLSVESGGLRPMSQ
jgi:hypothetical protein